MLTELETQADRRCSGHEGGVESLSKLCIIYCFNPPVVIAWLSGEKD